MPDYLSDEEVYGTGPARASAPQYLSDEEVYGAAPQPRAFGSFGRGFNSLQQTMTMAGREIGMVSDEEAAAAIARDERDKAQFPESESSKAGAAEIAEAGKRGWGATFLAVLRNPSFIMSTIGESIPQSLAPAAVGITGALAGGAAGSVGPVAGTAVGAAAGAGSGSFVAEYSASILDALKQAGVDLTDDKAVEAAMQNPTLISDARSRAAKRGLAVGLFDAMSAGIAGRIAGVVERAASKVGAAAAGKATGEIAEVGAQSVTGASGEAAAQVATDGRITDPGSVIMEGVAEAVTGVPEIVTGRVLSGGTQPQASPTVAPQPETNLPQGAQTAEALFGADPTAQQDGVDIAAEQAGLAPEPVASAPVPVAPTVTPEPVAPTPAAPAPTTADIAQTAIASVSPETLQAAQDAGVRIEPPAAAAAPSPEIAAALTPPPPKVQSIPATTPAAPEAVATDVERIDSPRLTDDDRSSPIPNSIIDDGKAILDEAVQTIDAQMATAPTTIAPNGQEYLSDAQVYAPETVRTPTTLPPIERRDIAQDVSVTASGREVPVTYAVVEAKSLVTSQNDAGGTNPSYPSTLQPRDRERAVSQTQINDIAQKLNPRLLDVSPRASDGAPIIAEDGVVESGNGRVLAIRQAYGQKLPTATAYKEYLAAKGYPVEGMTQPVLVRVRQGVMPDMERQAFTREANERDTLGMSSTERAMADAAAMPPQVLAQYRGGDLDAAVNRDFVRAFMGSVVSANDQAGMVDASGVMSQDAVRRIQGALLAKAFDDADLVASLIESPDTNIKAIGGALMDIAADWAQMRSEAASGAISPEVDATPSLLDAVRLVQRARREGRNVAEFVGQTDIFSGATVEPRTVAFLALMYRNVEQWTAPVGRDKLAGALRFYTTEARKTSPGIDLLGEAAPASDQLLKLAKERQYGPEVGQTESLFAGPGNANPSVSAGAAGPRGAGGNAQGAETATRAGGEGGDWVGFSPNSGTLGIPRAEMPQIKTEHRGALVNFLAARGITHEEEAAAPANLKPTQAEYSPAKVAQAQGFVGNDRAILTSSDGHVVDGHHQWIAKGQAGQPVRAIRLNAPIRDLLPIVAEFPSATKADGEPLAATVGQIGQIGQTPAGGKRDYSKPIGVNMRGNPIYEDEDGVRSYSERGVRVTESVELRPVRGGGYQTSIDTSKRTGNDYLTEDEARAEKPAQVASAPSAPSAKPSSDYGTKNVIFTEDAAEKARRLLRDKFKSQLSSGLDPELVQAGITLAGYHIEAGARSFAEFSRKMVDDLGEAARPFLRSWYEGVRYYPGFDAKGMTSAAEIEAEPVAQAAAPSQEAAAPSAPEAPAPSQEAAAPSLSAVQSLALAKAFGHYFEGPDNGFRTITEARKYAEERIGRKIETGTPDAKAVDEAIELGVVMAARALINGGRTRLRSSGVIFDRLRGLYERQPNLSVRTSTSVANQAYSTPVPLAFVASQLAGIGPSSTVYEPTAGNGALLIGADPKNVRANELDSERTKALREQGFATVTSFDGSEALKGSMYDAVIANPPFGAVRDDAGVTKQYQVNDRYSTGEVDHAISMASLKAMKDDGSAVLILGGINKMVKTEEARSDAYNGKAKREFYLTLYGEYNVVDHFTVAGELYAKQGAGWPVDVIVIKGRGKSARKLPAVDVPRILSSWEEVKGVLDAKYDAQPIVADNGTADRPAIRPDRPAAGGGNLASGPAVSGGRPAAPGNQDGGRPAGVRDGPDTGQRPTIRDGVGIRGPATAGAESENARPDSGRAPVAPRPEDDSVAVTDGRQVPYKPRSSQEGMGTLVPVNMQTAAGEALSSLEKRISNSAGSVDEYVANELGIEVSKLSKYFGAEQIDGIALAIDNFAKGAGFILGDQTGIGKGRQVAAVLRWAIRNGKTPIFVTEKPNLYADMYRDMTDIGIQEMLGRDLKILMTNSGETIPLNEAGTVVLKTPGAALHKSTLKRATAAGKLDGYDMVFTTYAQMQTVKGEETERMDLLRMVAANDGVVAFDESHNAGGTADSGMMKKKEGAPMNRAEFARELSQIASAVLYSSATYAKRPDVMDLYGKTDMRLAVDDISKLGELIAKGGVPMQQIVASMLSKAGQYVRRERSFDGVAYDSPSIDVNKTVYESFSADISMIQVFSEVHVKEAVKRMNKRLKGEGSSIGPDGSTGSAGASSIGFTAVMHNIIGQLLLSLKSDAAAQMAIDSLKAGEKPVITLANTNEAFLTEFADDGELQVGDATPIGFNDLLHRYLERSRTITVKPPFAKKGEYIKVYLTDEDLGPAGLAQYNATKKMIAETDFGNLPVSPIDYIKSRIRKAGFSVGELTGRSMILDYRADGVVVVAMRPGEERSIAGRGKSIKDFNSGALDVLILNRAGSTGLSLHTSSKFKNQNKRHMIIAQAEGNIDTHMQMLGRVHRTGQVITPRYSQLVADVPAEKRPASVLAKKMASLNANTTGARGSAVTAKDTPDFMNEYGDAVAAALMADNPDVYKMLGSPLKAGEEGFVKDGAMRKITGRIPLLRLAMQEQVYELLESEYVSYIQQIEAAGENALEAKTLDLDAVPLRSIEAKPAQEGAGDSPFAGAVYLEQMDVKMIGRPMKSEEVLELIASNLDGVRLPNSVIGDKSAALAQLQGEGRRKAEKISATARDEFRAYQRSVLDDIEAPDLNKATAEKLNDIQKRWTSLMSSAYPGVSVVLKTNSLGNLHGIVTDIKRTGKSKNPLALGSWKVTIALADASRSMTVPFSQLYTSNTAPSAPTASQMEIGREARIGLMPVIDAFDTMQGTRRERRVIVTGNMLAGYDVTKGKGSIINFTDRAGKLRPGIMMRRGFDVDNFMQTAPVRFNTGAQVLRFLKETKGAALYTTDRLAGIRMNMAAGLPFRVITEAGRATGGKYYMNSAVLAAAGRDFVKAGQEMRVDVSADRAPLVIDALMKLGAVFEAKDNFEAATAIVGAKPKFKREATGDAAPSDGVVNYTLTPEFKAQAAAVSADLRNRLDAMGLPDVGARVFETITATFEGKRYGVGGQYLNRVITVALNAPGTTFDHEALHALRDLALFTPNEWAILSRKSDATWRKEFDIAGNYGDMSAEIQTEEGIAHAYEAWVAGAKTDGIIAKSFRKIRSFMEALGNALRGRGFNSVGSIFAAATSGEIGSRPRDALGRFIAEEDAANPKGRGGKPMFQAVWHGTPHEFDRFTLDKIGTGEGAQAFGWGLYFTGKKEIAEHYRNAVSQSQGSVVVDGETVSSRGKRIGDTTARERAAIFAHQALSDGVDLRSKARGIRMRAREADIAPETLTDFSRGGGWGDSATLNASAEILEEWATKDVRVSGKLYQVDIPDDKSLMVWDKPLSEQPATVRDALRTVFDDIVNSQTDFHKASALSREFEDAAQGEKLGSEIYAELASYLGADVQTIGNGWGNTGNVGQTTARQPNPVAASEALRDAGIPGHRYLDGGSRSAGEGTYNYVIYDEDAIRIEARFKFTPGQEPQTAEDRAKAMQGFIARGQPLDRAMRIPFDLLGGIDSAGRWKPGKKLVDMIGRAGMQGGGIGGIVGAGIGTLAGGPVGTVAGGVTGSAIGAYLLGANIRKDGRMGWLHGFAENARAGLIDRYGLSEEYQAADMKRANAKRQIMQEASDILKVLKGASVGTREAAVLQKVLTGEDVTESDMTSLAVPIRKAIDDMGAEAVSLGLISAESFERNRGSYLHRVYLKHEVDEGGLSGWVARRMSTKRKKIIGDSMKGRGMFWDVDTARIMKDVDSYRDATRGDPKLGEKFRVLDEVSETGEMLDSGRKPRVLRRVYLPSDEMVPPRYTGAAWRDRGEWEVRKAGKTVTLWRDYTVDERTKMGEIVDARYTIAKTFMNMANDLSTGRFYKDIAENDEWTSTFEPATKWVEAGKFNRSWNDPEVAWVKVPDTAIANTGGKKRWGALSGKYVRAGIWRDLNELEVQSNPGTWRKILTMWKKNKTARNPVVHTNNIMSNLMFMDLADVRVQDLAAGVRAFATGNQDYLDAREHGAFGSDMISQEMREQVLQPILDEISKEDMGASNTFLARAGIAGRIADIIWTRAKKIDNGMLKAYQLEDEIFRMAMYQRRRALGDSPEMAAKGAREQFLDYDIRAPWVNAARNSLLPFLSYTYRAVPMLAQNLAHRPWKLAKYVALAYVANALPYLWDDGDDGEERERASMRTEEQGPTWLGIPRMLRMPFRDDDGMPVFLDVRRWIPAGDVFDVQQSNAALPVPAPLTFAGPPQMMFEYALNRQAFTGEDITNELTDDNRDKAMKVGDWLWKSWMPGALWVPNSWYWDKIGNSLRGATDKQDRPYPLGQSVLSSVGIKVRSQDVERGLFWHGERFKRVRSALKAEARDLGDQRERNLISQSTYEAGIARITEKYAKLGEKADDLQRRATPIR